MKFIEHSEQLALRTSHDIIVAGGGVAGVAAALSARRAGKSVLLIEKTVNLGGLATTGLINLFVPMCDGHGRRIISGMCDELLRLSIRNSYDTIPREWKNGEPGPGATQRYVSRFSHTIFALELTALLNGEGVDLLFDTVVSAPVMSGNRCLGLITENKSGREFHEAGMVIDATGDADILFRAGVPTVQGKNYFTYSAIAIDIEHCRRAAETGNINDAYFNVNGGESTLYGHGHPADERYYQGTSGEDVTEYIVRNQIKLLEKINGQDRFSRDIAALPYMAQLRTTRRIDGDYTLTTDDMGRRFEDSVGAICDFDNAGKIYETPLRTMTRRDHPNILTCGRSVSAAGYAWDVTRVIPPAIITGQAAGIAAAHALEQNCAAADVDIAGLQRALEDAGVMIHIPDDLPYEL